MFFSPPERHRSGPPIWLIAIGLAAAFAVAFAGALVASGGLASPPDRANLPTFGGFAGASATAEASATRSAAPATSEPPLRGTWTYNLFVEEAVRYQDPDMTACEAAAAMTMLNMAVLNKDYEKLDGRQAPASPTAWAVDVSIEKQSEILTYERKTGTMSLSSPGADAHGWRTALNFYGWGVDAAGVYVDQSYKTFDEAAKATIMGIALYRKPVGVLGWAGDHAQVISGYKVTGMDPRRGATDFVIEGVYLTDPLKADAYKNEYVPLEYWRTGNHLLRFTPYAMKNSPGKDAIDGKVCNTEWGGKWVIVAPVA
jgi:hypothetical protein